MNPLVLLLAGSGALLWWLQRRARAALSEGAQAAAELAIGEQEGAVRDLGAAPLPSIDVSGPTSATPDAPEAFVIPRLLEVLEPVDGATVDRPGLLGQTYPVTVRWTNALALDWHGKLVAIVKEGDRAERQIDLGDWTIRGGDERTAVVSIALAGGRINIGSTLVRLRLRFGDSAAVASYYVD